MCRDRKPQQMFIGGKTLMRNSTCFPALLISFVNRRVFWKKIALTGFNR